MFFVFSDVLSKTENRYKKRTGPNLGPVLKKRARRLDVGLSRRPHVDVVIKAKEESSHAVFAVEVYHGDSPFPASRPKVLNALVDLYTF